MGGDAIPSHHEGSPQKEPEAPVRPPRLGLLLVRESRQRKSPAPPDQAFPLANASSLKSVARFVRTLDRQAWQFSGGYAQSMRRVNLLAFSTVPAKKPS